jgi:Protein of unknown function (DUF2752)
MSAFTAWLEQHLLTCPIKAWCGCDCPGCGMQRSMLKLLEGDIIGSFSMHPAGMLVVALFIYLPLHLKFKFARGAQVIVVLYSLIFILTIANYIYKLKHGLCCS